MKFAHRLWSFGLLLLALMVAAGPARAVAVNDLQARVYTDAGGKKLPYRLFVPVNYDATKQYPLVVFLHGAGQRGDDNRAQVDNAGALVFVQGEAQVRYPCFFLAPQCPAGQQWVNTEWGKGSYSTAAVPISDPLRMTLETVQALQKEFSIDAKRLYVTGLSMGGYGAWDLVLRNPSLFAAVVPICGAGDPSQAAKLKGMGIWAFHSADDGTVPVSGSRDMIRALWAAGQTPGYTEYQDYGHFAWDPAYGVPGLQRWMFAFHR